VSEEGQSASSKRALVQSTDQASLGWLPNGIDALCEMFRASLHADVCLIALTDDEPQSAGQLYMANGAGAHSPRALSARLMVRASDGPAIYMSSDARGTDEHDAEVGSDEARRRLAALAGMLRVSSLITVPLSDGDRCIGRLYVGSNKKRYSSRDILPISRGARYACSLIASIRLAETLAKEAACQERRRISRDLHDSAMQPYIALKLGLEAMQRRLRGTPLAGELDELIKIANDGIGELRQYVVNLKNAAARKQLTSLLTAVRAQAKKFTEFYNIDAQVIAPTDISVSAPLRNDVIQIVREGLSNIRRHTAAERATINLREQRGCLLVEVINDNARREAKREFYPRSIGERATELGGRVSVRRGTGGRTVVAVELPLHQVA
jgi:nitrate/nitrite-specific signal transduction histidine kinase